ncbi:uncharacterized protein LOC103364080 isoform X2 [Stegastes partitus]|uniref:Uncharacterized protein LOC103364080 isoform X2 n=1 Tax=Stegastes partitus TaxID=144197 RepID=A0A9Y4K8Y4_9TELE|nr:PREDICTED: uncharacterized protein LOC103364080 isoform X2 [Stegastes partitus]
MSSVQNLRELINERLTAAAEEIFTEFEKTIVQYEEVIDRQRRLLDVIWKPQITLDTTGLPQQHVCEQEEVLADQQLHNQAKNSNLDQEDPESPQIKEEQEELCLSQDGEHLVLTQKTDMLVQCKSKCKELSREIFQVFEKTLIKYEKQINHQHRLLDIIRKPEIKLHTTSHSNMSVRRRRFSLRSSSVTRKGTHIWTRRTQSFHRLKRNRRTSVPVCSRRIQSLCRSKRNRRNSAPVWIRRTQSLCRSKRNRKNSASIRRESTLS